MLAMTMISHVVVVNLGVGMGSYVRVYGDLRLLTVVFRVPAHDGVGSHGSCECGRKLKFGGDVHV